MLAEAQGHPELAAIYEQQLTETQHTLTALRQRKERLEVRLSRKVISNEEIQSIEQLTTWAAPLLELADNDFEWRRRLVDAFNWHFTFLWRGQQQRIIVIHWRDWDIEVEVPPPPPRRWLR